MYEISFYAVGSFDFPIDMLRYDSCFPASESDSYRIIDSFKDLRPTIVNLKKHVEGKSMTILSHGVVTEARWSSFGYRIFDTREAAEEFLKRWSKLKMPINKGRRSDERK